MHVNNYISRLIALFLLENILQSIRIHKIFQYPVSILPILVVRLYLIADKRSTYGGIEYSGIIAWAVNPTLDIPGAVIPKLVCFLFLLLHYFQSRGLFPRFSQSTSGTSVMFPLRGDDCAGRPVTRLRRPCFTHFLAQEKKNIFFSFYWNVNSRYPSWTLISTTSYFLLFL